MKPADNNSLNKFILSFLSEDASDTIKAQGKATPKAGSVDAEEQDEINNAIAKAIEAGSMFEEDDAEDDKEIVSEEDEEDKDKEAVSEEDDSEEDKEVVSEDEDEDDKEKEAVSEEDDSEDDKKVVAEDEDEDELEFSQADLDDLEAELDDEDSIQEDDSFDPWPMRKGAVSEEDDSEEDKEVVSEDEDEEDKEVVAEEDEDDKDKEAVSEEDDSEDDKKVVAEEDEDDKEAVSEEDEFSGEDELKKDEDEDEIVLPKVDEDSEEEKLKFESNISAIFNGNEKLSEEQIKEKAKAIFEASVKHRVSKYVNKLNRIFKNAVMTESKNKTAKWSKALDRYLDHVVTEWKKENKVAIRRSVSDELTESISRDITQILKKRGVVIPENKVDAVKKSLSEAQALKKKLNEAEKANAALRESNNKAKGFLVKMLHRNAILKAVEGLKESEKAKILPVIKQITFKNEQDFLGKAKVIRESYVKKTSVKSETLVESKIKTSVNDKLDESTRERDPIMAGYLDSLDRTIKK